MKKAKIEDKIIVDEDGIIRAVTQLLADCDCDTLARIAGELFGGSCRYMREELYEFHPDANYGGAFEKFRP